MSTYILALEASAAHHWNGKYHVEHGSVRVPAVSRDAALRKGIALAERLDIYASHKDAYGWTARAEASIVGVA